MPLECRSMSSTRRAGRCPTCRGDPRERGAHPVARAASDHADRIGARPLRRACGVSWRSGPRFEAVTLLAHERAPTGVRRTVSPGPVPCTARETKGATDGGGALDGPVRSRISRHEGVGGAAARSGPARCGPGLQARREAYPDADHRGADGVADGQRAVRGAAGPPRHARRARAGRRRAPFGREHHLRDRGPAPDDRRPVRVLLRATRSARWRGSGHQATSARLGLHRRQRRPRRDQRARRRRRDRRSREARGRSGAAGDSEGRRRAARPRRARDPGSEGSVVRLARVERRDQCRRVCRRDRQSLRSR